MAGANRTLDEIGRSFGTDKSSTEHGYLAAYEPYLAELRFEPARILEIGVYGGASLATWEEYFPHAQIVGVDINPETMRFERERVAIEIADQGNVEELTRIAVKHGPFDLIVEDGSHQWEHQITSLRTLFPFVNSGGVYVVEDLHVNYPRHAAAYQGNATISCMEYLKKLVDLRVANQEVDVSAVEDSFLRTYGNNVDSITFIKHACILRKGHIPARLAAEQYESILPDGRERNLVRVQGHIGFYGDIWGRDGCISGGATRDHRNIQGFALFAPALADDALSYRARFSDGSWTEWVSPPSFVGTRGMSQDLTGLELRLNPSGGLKYSLQVAGKFRGSDEAVVSGDGQACLPRGEGALYALQVHLVPR